LRTKRSDDARLERTRARSVLGQSIGKPKSVILCQPKWTADRKKGTLQFIAIYGVVIALSSWTCALTVLCFKSAQGCPELENKSKTLRPCRALARRRTTPQCIDRKRGFYYATATLPTYEMHICSTSSTTKAGQASPAQPSAQRGTKSCHAASIFLWLSLTKTHERLLLSSTASTRKESDML
jgi:hypothetical protein